MNMDITMNPLALNEIGMEALSKALSPVEVARFLRLYDKGSGGHTEERELELDGFFMGSSMTVIKGQEIEMIKRLADEKVSYVVNILEGLEGLYLENRESRPTDS